LRSARILEREELRVPESASTFLSSAPTAPSATVQPATSEVQMAQQGQALDTSAVGRPTIQQPVFAEGNTVPIEVLEGLLQLFGTHTGSRELSLDSIETFEKTLSEARGAIP